MGQLLLWSKGNPGALSFLMMLVEPVNIALSLTILAKLEDATSIRGTNLWVLFSDLCNKDLEVCAKLCKTCPTDILEDACSRQDYSGRKLVAEYLA